jgi:hypothetical protein
MGQGEYLTMLQHAFINLLDKLSSSNPILAGECMLNRFLQGLSVQVYLGTISLGGLFLDDGHAHRHHYARLKAQRCRRKRYSLRVVAP